MQRIAAAGVNGSHPRFAPSKLARSIGMTAVAMIAGMLPIALGPGAND
jgi:multidrug efflux pump subunit AcrB